MTFSTAALPHAEQVIARLLQRVEQLREDQGGCWAWLGTKNDDGYGRTRINGRTYTVHRLVYEHFHGAVPDGAEVCHTCDVRHCVRPSHLFAASHADNIRDAKEKGRMRGGNYGRTHCHRGHEFTPENTTTRPNGARLCKTCRAEWFRNWKEQRRAS
jgi:hypothetical protein